MAYGVIGNTTVSGTVILGSSPGRPAPRSSSGLGRRPLTPVTRVQIPYGVQNGTPSEKSEGVFAFAGRGAVEDAGDGVWSGGWSECKDFPRRAKCPKFHFLEYNYSIPAGHSVAKKASVMLLSLTRRFWTSAGAGQDSPGDRGTKSALPRGCLHAELAHPGGAQASIPCHTFPLFG